MSEIDPEAAAAPCPPAIPEDIVVEILARVPDLVSLFRCSAVCKRWRGLVADPVFLRRRWPEGDSSLAGTSLLGFFVQRHRINTSARRKISRLFPSRAPAFVPAPDSILGPDRRFLTSFVRDDAGLLDEAKPLVARGGLLLVRVQPRSWDKTSVLRLCVCNLLTGRFDLLPPLDASLLHGVQGYGIVTAADHDAGQPHPLVDGYSTLFQVLLVGIAHEDGHLHLLKFSSAAARSRSWYAYDCRNQTGVVMSGPKGCSTAVIAGGTAKWLFYGNNPGAERPSLYTLDVSVDTGHISATMLPFGAFQPWLCTIDARLSLLHIDNNNRLVIWSHGYQQDGALAWRPTRFVKVAVEVGLFGTESLSPVCAGENSGTMLALYHSDPECAYIVDLQYGSATKVAGWTRSFNYMTAVPFEINWSMLFMSRLGLRFLVPKIQTLTELTVSPSRTPPPPRSRRRSAVTDAAAAASPLVPSARRAWPHPHTPPARLWRHRSNTSAQRKISRLFPSRAPAFVPAPDSVLGPERRFLTSFVRDDAGLLDEAKPLVARGGLLLVRVQRRSWDKASVLRLCVCNLLTGRRERLPPLDASLLDSDGVQGYGLVTAADHGARPPPPLVNGYSTLFQVLLIGVAHEDRHVNLLKFSSAAAGSRRWYTCNCSRRIGFPMSMWGPKGCTTAAIAGGAAHWLFHGINPGRPSMYTLDVSVDTTRISATMLPFVDASHPWLCTIDARLSLLLIYDNNQLVIWSRYQQDGALVWRQARFLQFAVETGVCWTESLYPVCTGESCGTVLALYHSDPKFAYMLDLRSRLATKVAGWTRSFNYMTAVPFEINWAMLFLSRLGTSLLGKNPPAKGERIVRIVYKTYTLKRFGPHIYITEQHQIRAPRYVPDDTQTIRGYCQSSARPDAFKQAIASKYNHSTSCNEIPVITPAYEYDPTFLRRRWPEGGSSLGGPSLLGFFVQRHRINISAQRKISRLFPSRAPAFVPAPDSVLGPERRFLTSFVRDDAGLLDEAKPLPRSSDKTSVLRLCVCNLLTGRRELLPPLDASLLDGEGVQGYGLVTAADHGAGPPPPLVNGYSTLFQVLLFGVTHEDPQRQLLKFSSAAAGSRRWYTYGCGVCQTGVQMSGPKGGSIVAAIARGTAHWLFHGNDPDGPSLYTLDVSINTGRVSATILPFDVFQHAIRMALSYSWLCTIDSKLSLLYIRNNQLVIWSHGYQDGALAWRRTRSVQIGLGIGLFGESLSPVCGGENCGTVLALYKSDPQCAYVLDLQSGSATKVAGWTRSFNYMTAVPYEINWPMFFMSQLGDTESPSEELVLSEIEEADRSSCPL
ncbi:hypothetical protein EJB05_09694, partial [Eragrostis curvula]